MDQVKFVEDFWKDLGQSPGQKNTNLYLTCANIYWTLFWDPMVPAV